MGAGKEEDMDEEGIDWDRLIGVRLGVGLGVERGAATRVGAVLARGWDWN